MLKTLFIFISVAPFPFLLPFTTDSLYLRLKVIYKDM